MGKLQSTLQKLLHTHQRHLEHMQLEQLRKFLPLQVVCNFPSFLPLTVRRPRRGGEAREGETFFSRRSPLRSHLACKRHCPGPSLPGEKREEGEEKRSKHRRSPGSPAPHTHPPAAARRAAAPLSPAEPRPGGPARCAPAAPGGSCGRLAGGDAPGTQPLLPPPAGLGADRASSGARPEGGAAGREESPGAPRSHLSRGVGGEASFPSPWWCEATRSPVGPHRQSLRLPPRGLRAAAGAGSGAGATTRAGTQSPDTALLPWERPHCGHQRAGAVRVTVLGRGWLLCPRFREGNAEEVLTLGLSRSKPPFVAPNPN